MRVGITGADGFIGWHLRCYLHSLGNRVSELRLANRETFADQSALSSFIDRLDLIVHLAGINRATDDELMEGNLRPARQLVEALKVSGSKAVIVFASTTHAQNPSTAYGNAKAGVVQIFRHWSETANGRFINLIIPHVYGEYSKPFYNSGVATFCHQLTHDQIPEINPDGQLELVHVQDLVEMMISLFDQRVFGDQRIKGICISVPEVVSKLQYYVDEYISKSQLPDLTSTFDRNLFNTLRSFIEHSDRSRHSVLRSDSRGWLVETVKAGSGGQCFVSSSHPGITRGNHYHRRKVERFFVLQGQAEIKIRKLFTDDVVTYQADGENPSYIDMPTLHTHNIKNTGKQELITLFWSDEYFDPQKPDTYFEDVE